MGIEDLHIKGDSKSFIDVVNFGRLLGWSTKDILLDINIFVSKLNLKVATHIYREGNRVADALANFGTHWKVSKCWYNLGNLLPGIQGLILKEQGPYLIHDNN